MKLNIIFLKTQKTEDYKNLFNFITGLLCIYPETTSVELDFSLVNSIKTEGNTQLSNIVLEVYTQNNLII